MKSFVLLFLLSLSHSKLLDIDQLYSNDTQLFGELYNQTMEWGTYKPNLFFGLKNRSPKPVTIGMAWLVP